MRIYVASYFNTRDRITPYVRLLAAQGHTITSSWLDEVPRGDIKKTETSLFTQHELLHFAVRDVLELKGSESIILDVVDVTPRGGREVEWGSFVFGPVSYGFLIGPPRNVFHELATAKFKTWEECLEFFNCFTV